MVLTGHSHVVTCLLFVEGDKSKKIITESYYYSGEGNKKKGRLEMMGKEIKEKEKEE